MKAHQSKSLLWPMRLLFINSLTTKICQFNPFACTSKLKIEQYKLEVQYIDKVFHATYRKFLTVIDHLDYHPSQVQNTIRGKRSKECDVHGYYHSYVRTLTPSEEICLDKFLMALYKVNHSLHQDLSRMKRFGVLPVYWVGVFTLMPKAFQRLRTTYVLFKGKINYKINKSNIWLNT